MILYQQTSKFWQRHLAAFSIWSTAWSKVWACQLLLPEKQEHNTFIVHDIVHDIVHEFAFVFGVQDSVHVPWK